MINISILEILPVLSGVLQGKILGPCISVIIYIDYLPAALFSC